MQIMNTGTLPAGPRPHESAPPQEDYFDVSWELNRKLLALIRPMETLKKRPDQETARFCVGRWGDAIHSMRYTGGLEWVGLWYREETEMYEKLKASVETGGKSPQEVYVWLDVGIKRLRASLKLMKDNERRPFASKNVDKAIHSYVVSKLMRG